VRSTDFKKYELYNIMSCRGSFQRSRIYPAMYKYMSA